MRKAFIMPLFEDKEGCFVHGGERLSQKLGNFRQKSNGLIRGHPGICPD